MKLLPKITTVFGLRGSGKTEFVKNLINTLKVPTFIYDWHGEYKNVKGQNRFYYIPLHKSEFDKRRQELNKIFKEVVIPANNETRPIKLSVLDEANQYCPSKPTPLPDAILQIVDNTRHWKQGFICVARRPTQLHTDLVELADNRVFFKLTGKNDRSYLNNLYEGLGDTVLKLPKYHFVVLEDKPKVFKPIKLIN